MTPPIRSHKDIAEAESFIREQLAAVEGEIARRRASGDDGRPAGAQDLSFLLTSRQTFVTALSALKRERSLADLRDELAAHPAVARVSWSLDWVASGSNASLAPASLRLDLQTRDLSFHRVSVRRDVPAAAFREAILSMLDRTEV